MAFQFINYAGIPAQGNPALRNLAQSLMQGYQAARLPTQIGQEEKQRELANRLREMQVQYEPERQRLARQLTAAQIQKALRPAQPALSNIEKAIEGTERIKNQYGEDSAQYKAAQEYVQRLAQGTGTQLSVDPKTGAVTFSQGGYRGGPATEIRDGKIIQRPTTPTATALQKGGLANVLRQEIAQHVEQPYVGTGSNFSLLMDRIAYNNEKDPKKKKEIGERLVSAAVASKLVPEYAAGQLQAQGTTPTVSAIHEQRQAITQGWPESLHFVVNNLPSELQNQAKIKHDELIGKLNRAREKYISEGLPIELEDKNEKNEQQKEEDLNPSDVIETAQYFNTTPENVIEAKKAGIKTASEMRKWLRNR